MSKVLCGLAILLVILTASFVLSKQNGAEAESLGGLSFNLTSDSESYTLGKMVTLKMEVANASGKPVLVRGQANVANGRVRIFISRNGVNFKEYSGPGWGLHDELVVRDQHLQPSQAYESIATILYSVGEDTSHLNPTAAARISARMVETGYVFGQPGVYWVKAMLYDSKFDSSKESNTIQILVREPRGGDLKIWGALKNNPKYGYFIQTGESPYPLSDPRTDELVTALEEIAASHPDSDHKQDIDRSLLKFKSTKEKLSKRKP